jgi:hypothetical protein
MSAWGSLADIAPPAIPDLRPLNRRVINATSLFHGPHSIFAKRLVCCADQSSLPAFADILANAGRPARFLAALWQDQSGDRFVFVKKHGM